MRQIRFTIAEEEIKEVAEKIGVKRLSVKQVNSVLEMLECDEMLAKDIETSIIGAINDL